MINLVVDSFGGDASIWYEWVVLPLLIFVARITDQSVGTLRFLFIARGQKKLVPILGFIETLIWILVIREILSNLNNPLCFVAYAAGFATGNYIGLMIEEKLSMGNVIARVIVQRDIEFLATVLKENNFGYTLVDAEGSAGKVKVVFAVLQRVDLPRFLDILNKNCPSAFYSLEDIKTVKEGIFPKSGRRNIFRELLTKDFRK